MKVKPEAFFKEIELISNKQNEEIDEKLYKESLIETAVEIYDVNNETAELTYNNIINNKSLNTDNLIKNNDCNIACLISYKLHLFEWKIRYYDTFFRENLKRYCGRLEIKHDIFNYLCLEVERNNVYISYNSRHRICLQIPFKINRKLTKEIKKLCKQAMFEKRLQKRKSILNCIKIIS